jgi:DNA-binding MarR family transcriptional regulator
MRLMLDLLTAIYWLDDALQENLEATGFIRLSRAKSFIIANIALGERRATSIARNLGVSRQAVSLMLADLEQRGLITFERDPEDGRARVVVFTSSFRKQGDAARQILTDLEVEIGRRIGGDRLNLIRDVLRLDWGEHPRLPAHDATAPATAAKGQRRTAKSK